MHFKMAHFNIKNAKSTVRQSQVCYLRTTHSSALNKVVLKSTLRKFIEPCNFLQR